MTRNVIKIAIILLIVLVLELFLGRYINMISEAKTEENINEDKQYSTDEIYDVILFWGQSNMTGYCGAKEKNGEKQEETRYNVNNNESINYFSGITGISTDILQKNTTVNHVDVSIRPGTIYEYKYSTNNIEEISSQTETLGEMLEYNAQTSKLQKCERKSFFSLEESYGTNLIPQFCADYYKTTGHKVVAIMASNSGEEIAHFLPNEEANKYSSSVNYYKKNQYIYEAMIEKYNSAIKFLEQNGYKIGNKMYVSFQGENDANCIQDGKETVEQYVQKFQKLHNYLVKQCDIKLGALIETSNTIGEDKYNGVKAIHEAQEYLIKNNDNIILGSNYSYKHYVPNREVYDSADYLSSFYVDEYGNKLNYDEAYLYASYSMCLQKPRNNVIHFTSVALAQIGREVANNITTYLRNKNEQNNYKIEYLKQKQTINFMTGFEFAYDYRKYYIS